MVTNQTKKERAFEECHACAGQSRVTDAVSDHDADLILAALPPHDCGYSAGDYPTDYEAFIAGRRSRDSELAAKDAKIAELIDQLKERGVVKCRILQRAHLAERDRDKAQAHVREQAEQLATLQDEYALCAQQRHEARIERDALRAELQRVMTEAEYQTFVADHHGDL